MVKYKGKFVANVKYKQKFQKYLLELKFWLNWNLIPSDKNWTSHSFWSPWFRGPSLGSRVGICIGSDPVTGQYFRVESANWNENQLGVPNSSLTLAGREAIVRNKTPKNLIPKSKSKWREKQKKKQQKWVQEREKEI